MKRSATIIPIPVACSIFLFASSKTRTDEDGADVFVAGPYLPWSHSLALRRKPQAQSGFRRSPSGWYFLCTSMSVPLSRWV
jgi:hypothetical protein